MGLDDDPFTWVTTKEGRVLIFRAGRRVPTFTGTQADRSIPKLAGSPDEAQHALARATGNDRRGNEDRKPPR